MSNRDKKSLTHVLWQLERGMEICCDPGDWCIEIPKTTTRRLIRRLRNILNIKGTVILPKKR